MCVIIVLIIDLIIDCNIDYLNLGTQKHYEAYLHSWKKLDVNLERYQLPVMNISSCAIDIHDNIYITTAKSENIDEQFGGALLYLKFIK